MNSIKVSVIVPVYNVEKYLEKCLDSLVNQTLEEIEIIVVNDGSPDNSQEIIDRYVKKYPEKVKTIYQKNQGLSDARNNGLKVSSGEYIVFVDSDDYVELDYLKKAYNSIKEQEADVVIFGNNVVDENYKILSSTYPNNFKYNSDTEKIIFGNMCAWNKMFKKSLLVKNNLKFRSSVWYEDLDYSYKVFLESKKTIFLEENLYNYLLRPNSIMNSSKAHKNLEIIDAIDEIINYSKSNNLYDENHNVIEYLCTYHVYICAITRIINSSISNDERKELIYKMIKYTKTNFPNFKNNKFIRKIPLTKKIIYHLINLRQFWLVRLIFYIKR